MLNLTKRYADELMTYAEEQGINIIFRQALFLTSPNAQQSGLMPPEIGKFIEKVPAESREHVLYLFLDKARKIMDLLPVEIISAVELRPEQLETLERKLIVMFKKQLDITLTVDPSILGGLRIIAQNTVLDDTIKRKLQDMKERIYQGVYFR